MVRTKVSQGIFAELDWEKRVSIIQQARNGGSITPAMGMQLRRQVSTGYLKIDENCQVLQAEWLGNNWLVKCSNGSSYEYERIWLSTGSKFDVMSEPLLTEILDAYSIPIVKGFPVLDTCLRLPGCELFIMGGLAAMQVYQLREIYRVPEWLVKNCSSYC